MATEKDIFNKLKNNNPNDVYDLPEGYFSLLNDKLNEKINIEYTIKKPKLISLNYFAKIAAIFLLITGAYYILQYILISPEKNTISVSLSKLNESMDEYLLSDDELFYTFVDNDNDYEYINIEENIDDYFKSDIEFY